MLLTRTDYSIFKQNNRIEICIFIYQIQSIVIMKRAVADLLYNKNIRRQSRRRHARLTKFFYATCKQSLNPELLSLAIG